MKALLPNLSGMGTLKKVYLLIISTLSTFLACHTDLKPALYFFMLATIVDTISAIDVQARAKGLKFNPLKGYFWKQIKSSGLRDWCKKVLWDYGRYLLMAFAISNWVLKNTIVFDAFDRKLTLPVVALYIFGGIELWSIGENIEKTGGLNLFKRVIQFLPPNVQQIFQPNQNTEPTAIDQNEISNN